MPSINLIKVSGIWVLLVSKNYATDLDFMLPRDPLVTGSNLTFSTDGPMTLELQLSEADVQIHRDKVARVLCASSLYPAPSMVDQMAHKPRKCAHVTVFALAN